MKYIIYIIAMITMFSCSKEEDLNIDDKKNDSTPTIHILESNIKFNNSLTYGTLIDQEGNVYKTIQIGNKTWMAENLKVKKFQNGDAILTTTTVNKNINFEMSPKYQWAYDGDETNIVNYGRMYTGFVATDTRNVCPEGWHVSNFDDWTDLINSLEGDYFIAKRNYGGDKIKETDTLHWTKVNTDITNSTGFTALPAGYRSGDGSFGEIGNGGGWWKVSTDAIKKEYVTNNSPSIIETAVSMYSAYSIRCVKD